jgi:hypothetical protein
MRSRRATPESVGWGRVMGDTVASWRDRMTGRWDRLMELLETLDLLVVGLIVLALVVVGTVLLVGTFLR